MYRKTPLSVSMNILLALTALAVAFFVFLQLRYPNYRSLRKEMRMSYAEAVKALGRPTAAGEGVIKSAGTDLDEYRCRLVKYLLNKDIDTFFADYVPQADDAPLFKEAALLCLFERGILTLNVLQDYGITQDQMNDLITFLATNDPQFSDTYWHYYNN